VIFALVVDTGPTEAEVTRWLEDVCYPWGENPRAAAEVEAALGDVGEVVT
jgi:hypothetical protein